MDPVRSRGMAIIDRLDVSDGVVIMRLWWCGWRDYHQFGSPAGLAKNCEMPLRCRGVQRHAATAFALPLQMRGGLELLLRSMSRGGGNIRADSRGRACEEKMATGTDAGCKKCSHMNA